MPGPHGNLTIIKQLIQPLKLIVNQRFEWADIHYPNGSRWIFLQYGQNREKCSFRLARSSSGGNDNMLVGVHNGIASFYLYFPQVRPSFPVYVFLNKGSIPLKCTTTHMSNSANRFA